MFRTTLCVFSIVLLSTQAYAGLAVSNLGAGSSSDWGINSGFWSATRFETTDAAFLDNVVLTVSNMTSLTDAGIFAAIYSDNAGPDSMLGSMLTTPTDLTTTAVDATFTPTGGSILLSAATDYWLVVGATAAGPNPKYSRTEATGAGDWTLHTGIWRSLDMGTNWSPVGGGSAAMSTFHQAINVSAVPEPGSFLCLGLVGVGLIGWKKLKRNTAGEPSSTSPEVAS